MFHYVVFWSIVLSLQTPIFAETGASNKIEIANIDQCIQIALENNRNKQISQHDIEIAESQYRQALSAYWPQIKTELSGLRMDQDPYFIFPEETSTYSISGMFPYPIDATVRVPQKDVKLMNRDNLISSIQLAYPLMTGGKIDAIIKQATNAVEIAKISARRTDLQIMYDVKRIYFASVLANKLKQIGDEILEQFKATLKLTEHMYQQGSGRVKKTDFLRTKTIVSTIASTLALLESNRVLAQSALTNYMGLSWKQEVILKETDIPFNPIQLELSTLVGQVYQFNPDWNQIEFALKAIEAMIKEAQSGYFPIIALIGQLTHIENAYNKGVVGPKNTDNWAIGVAVHLPLFEGFLTENRVKEAKAKLNKLKQQQILLKEGLALQIKDTFLQINRAQTQVMEMKQALESAEENCDLNIRAYQLDLVETKEVIDAQIFLSLVKAQYMKGVHDHAFERARLEFLMGQTIQQQLE